MFGPYINLNRLESRITAFEEQPIVKNMIMFYGDSSFTRWKEPKFGNPNLEDVIRMKDGSQACVNHGFGSSTAEEQLYYYPRAVKPWEPRALVLQTIDNDVDLGYSPMEIMQLQARLMDYARTDFPGIRFFLCNVRPVMTHIDAPKVVRIRINEYNDLAKAYSDRYPDVTYVDHNTCAGLFEEGRQGDPEGIRQDFFVKDRLHYNAAGYEVYRQFFTEILDDLL